MAFVMFLFDRPADAQNGAEYARRAKEWTPELLLIPGAVSFMAYRAADEASPNTITALEFRTLDEARAARTSAQMAGILQSLWALGANPTVLVMERSPFTPEPTRA